MTMQAEKKSSRVRRAGGLTLLIALALGVVMLTVPANKAREKEDESMQGALRAADLPAAIPPIDRAAPRTVETASFALG